MFPIELDVNARVTFIDQKNDQRWPQWKLFKDCQNGEKEKINLGTPHAKYILLDKDLGVESPRIIDEEYQKLKRDLGYDGIGHFIADKTRAGFHIFIPTTNLDKQDPEVQKEIRNIYIQKYNCDVAKKSNLTVVSLPGRPHFKTNETYGLIETLDKNPILTINESVIRTAKERVEKRSKLLRENLKDIDFKDYFEKDPFLQYIKNNIIPDGTNRDLSIFPNLALACIKSGKNMTEIKSLIEPIIKKNFPGKSYSEFLGWLRKASLNEIKDYNPYQLNIWMKEYSVNKSEIYDLKPIIVDGVEEIAKTQTEERKRFLTDDELHNMPDIKIEWLVENWLPKGDICFIAGKAASFKTTSMLHFAYSIAEGKLVFNKYKTMKTKVLYLNEENSKSLFKSNFIRRIKNGLDISGPVGNMHHSLLENWRLDQIDHIEILIDYINKNKIEVLFCDSFRRFISFDENNATETNKLFNNLKYIRNQCNDLTIVILHHLKKENVKFAGDERDALRGSSDIVNSADSIIGISRKTGQNRMKIEHIKNRAGEEIKGKIVSVDDGENKDMAYFHEIGEVENPDHPHNKVEEVAKKVMEYANNAGLTIFGKDEILTNLKTSNDSTTKALKFLVDEGSLGVTGTTRNRMYRKIM